MEGNPVNRVDQSGLSPQHPNWWEGILIHTMIMRDFLGWGNGQGFLVGTNVGIQHASKRGNGNIGFADLVDFDHRQVYEIKPRGRGFQAVFEAAWYAYFLDRDPLHAGNTPWTGGTLYLSNEKVMGVWPNYPDYDVKAKLWGLGAVTYWGEHTRGSSNNPERVPGTAWDTLYKLKLLIDLCEGLLEANRPQPPERQPQPAQSIWPDPTAVKIIHLEAKPVPSPLEDLLRRLGLIQ